MKRTLKITTAVLLALSFSSVAMAKKGALKPVPKGKSGEVAAEVRESNAAKSGVRFDSFGKAKKSGRLAPLTSAQKKAAQIVERVEVVRPENISAKETILNIIRNRVDAGRFNHSMAVRINKRNTELKYEMREMNGDHLNKIINTTEDGRTRNPKEPCKPKGA